MTIRGIPPEPGRARCGVSGMPFQIVSMCFSFDTRYRRASLRLASETLMIADVHQPAIRSAGSPANLQIRDVPSAKHQVWAVNTDGTCVASAASLPTSPAFDV